MARLLLVDDEAGLRRGLAGFLRLAGHEVREAGGLAEALDLAGREPPEMVITDLRMEDGSGMDLARAMAALAPRAPVILVTGYAEKETLRGERPPMMVEVLEKPVRPRDLREAVLRILGDRPAPRPARAAQPPPAVSACAAERRDLRRALWGEEA